MLFSINLALHRHFLSSFFKLMDLQPILTGLSYIFLHFVSVLRKHAGGLFEDSPKAFKRKLNDFKPMKRSYFFL